MLKPLSSSMRQRVGIAMSMSFQPKLPLADEPTGAADIMRVLKAHNSDASWKDFEDFAQK